MEEEMEELYTEGIATHGDPESCVASCKGRGEALTGARAGQAIEPRNHRVRGADAVYEAGRQHCQRRYRESLAGPARSKTLCMYGTSMRENREIPGSPAWLITGRAAQGRLRPYA
jgi:RNA-directed DNA polymerase